MCPRYFSVRRRQLWQMPLPTKSFKTQPDRFVKVIAPSPMNGGVILRYGGCELRFPEPVTTAWLSELIKSLL